MPWAHLSGSSRVLEELHPAVGFDDWKSLRWWGELGGLWGDGSWSGGIESLEDVFLSCRTRRVSNKPWLLELESKHLLYVKIQTFLLMKFPCSLFKICVVHQHLQLFWLPKVIWHQSQTSQKARPLFLTSQLIATPSMAAPRTLASSCLPSGCGTSWMSSCTTTSRELQIFLGIAAAIYHPSHPRWSMAVGSCWCSRGSDISTLNISGCLCVKHKVYRFTFGHWQPTLYVDDPGAANWDGTL